MGMGIGAAMTGLRVIIEGMNMGFLLLAYNQISNNAGMLHYTSGGQFKVWPCPTSMPRSSATAASSGQP
jgi:pyruvate dehydrogenase E1 component beta subunit